jgi:hypothetical protein
MAATNVAKQRSMRQEQLRELLSKQKLVEKVIDTAKKLDEQGAMLEQNELQALKASADIRLKLINKYLPDLKSQEITGADGDALTVSVIRKRFDGDN